MEIANDPNIRTYQNQTAEDIESGRARMDSVTSYGSGGSDEALLPEVRITNSSPRRGNRENLPLLRGRQAHQRLHDYEDIDVESVNVFAGNFKAKHGNRQVFVQCHMTQNFQKSSILLFSNESHLNFGP